MTKKYEIVLKYIKDLSVDEIKNLAKKQKDEIQSQLDAVVNINNLKNTLANMVK